MALTPTADEITVRGVLAEFEAKFAPVADAVENGEFALWVGSGISRQAPNLGDLIERAFDYIRERAIDPASAAAYMPALEEALGLAQVEPARVRAQYGQPLAVWPEHDAIIGRLWARYSRVLDIRIGGTDVDFILWEAIDIRQAFEHPAPPAAEHLCIAMLVLEGAVEAIASANWDGFIEAAIERLSSGVQGIIRVVVDPDAVGAIIAAAIAPSAERAAAAGGQIDLGRKERVRQAVRRHLRTPTLGPRTLCRLVGMSRSNLYRLFDDIGGVARYIQRERLLAAQAVLSDATTTRSISAIAEDLCFADTSSFSRDFKREFGHSPSEGRSAALAGLLPSTTTCPRRLLSQQADFGALLGRF